MLTYHLPGCNPTLFPSARPSHPSLVLPLSAVIATARWVGFRLDLICALTLTATALLAVAAQVGGTHAERLTYSALPHAPTHINHTPSPAVASPGMSEAAGAGPCSDLRGRALICILPNIIHTCMVLPLSSQGMVKPQLLGLALTYIMSIMGVMQWFVRQTAEVGGWGKDSSVQALTWS